MKLAKGKLEIDLRDIIDSLSLEEKHQLAEQLIWDKEIFDEVVDYFAKSAVVTASYNSWLYEARLRLIELLPAMNQEIARSLQYEIDSAREEARRYCEWAWRMYHAWPESFRHHRPEIESLRSIPFPYPEEAEKTL